MSLSFLAVLIVLTLFFAALLIIPLFLAPGRRERGFIYAAELALVFLAWLKIRKAFLIQNIWLWPRQVDDLRAFLMLVLTVTALFFLYQFVPRKEPPDEESRKP